MAWVSSQKYRNKAFIDWNLKCLFYFLETLHLADYTSTDFSCKNIFSSLIPKLLSLICFFSWNFASLVIDFFFKTNFKTSLRWRKYNLPLTDEDFFQKIILKTVSRAWGKAKIVSSCRTFQNKAWYKFSSKSR